MPSRGTISPTAILVAIVAIVLVVLAGILLVSSDDAGNIRLGLLLGVVGLVLPALIGMLRGDMASQALDGTLDARITAAALRANYVRRASDVTPEAAAPAGREAVDDAVNLGTIDPANPPGPR